MINSCLKRFEKKWGFTLIELLVVISIIGILTALGAMSFTQARRASRDTRRLGDIKTILTALEQYYADNGRYPATCNSGNGPWCCSNNTGGNTAASVFGDNVDSEIIAGPSNGLNTLTQDLGTLMLTLTR